MTPRVSVSRRLDQVAEGRTEWLWPNRFPCGAFSLIAGDPSAGKSTLALDIAARVSTGAAWPDGNGFAPLGAVVLVQVEDDFGSTVVPRLRVAGADLRQIHTVEGWRYENSPAENVWTLAHIDALRQTVLDVGARLVIIDPIGAFMGRVDGNDSTEVRGAILPLQKLAAETGAAIIAVAHPNKGGNGQRAMHRVSGSLALVAASRAAWFVIEDQDDRERRLFLKAKMNLARDVGGLAYRVVDQGGHPRIEWESGRVDLVADDLLMDSGDGGKLADAEEWLGRALKDGDRSAKDLESSAKRDRIAWRTVQRAKDSLHVRSYQHAGGWVWSLSRLPSDPL